MVVFLTVLNYAGMQECLTMHLCANMCVLVEAFVLKMALKAFVLRKIKELTAELKRLSARRENFSGFDLY